MKRKNIIYYLSLAMLLGACTEANEIDNPSIENEVTYGDRAVTFGNSLDSTTTKGVVIEDVVSMQSMGVYSYITLADETWGVDQSSNTVTGFLNDYATKDPIEVTYGTPYWSYGSDVRYWPSDGSKLHFYAWAPYGVISRTFDTSSNYPIFTHTLSANGVDNVDLLWADAKVNLQYESNTSNPGVPVSSGETGYKTTDDLNSDGYVNEGTVHFDFSHALSRITLYARMLVSSKVSIADYAYFTSENVAAYNTYYNTSYEAGDPIPYTSYTETADGSIPDNIYQTVNPTNIFVYERFGINGITFYNVVSTATATYVPDDAINVIWSPSWILDTDSRVSITASQDNTLLAHENNIRNEVGQVPKVDEAYVDAYEGTGIVTSSFANVMMVDTADLDDDGETTDTHGIFLLPQTFSVDSNGTATGSDSPNATIDMRVRYYDNKFISVVDAETLLDAHKEDYLDYLYCLDTNGTVAVIDFELKTLNGVTINTDADGNAAYINALDQYDMDDDEFATSAQDPNGDLGGNYYIVWADAFKTRVSERYYLNPNYQEADTTYKEYEYICYTWSDPYTAGDKFGLALNDDAMPTSGSSQTLQSIYDSGVTATITVSYVNEADIPSDAELRYQCVEKDLDGSIYSTTQISLADVFTGTDFKTTSAEGEDGYGLKANQHAALYFTFDLTDGVEILVPMTVEAKVLNWVDVDIEESVDDQLVIYCDTQTISGSGTLYFYTKCQDDIAVMSVTGANMTLDNKSSNGGTARYSGFTQGYAYTVAGSANHVTHTVSYSAASDGASITVLIEKTNGQQVTKRFTFSVE